MTTKPNTQDVPLLSATMVSEALPELVTLLDPEESNAELLDALQAIADGRAAVYNTATHEVVPLGTREAVEWAISQLRDVRGAARAAVIAIVVDELQRALEGGR